MIVRKTAILDRLEGKQAVFVLENGQELMLPREEVGPLATVGASFVLQLLPEGEAALEREELARTLLNQLLCDETPSET